MGAGYFGVMKMFQNQTTEMAAQPCEYLKTTELYTYEW